MQLLGHRAGHTLDLVVLVEDDYVFFLLVLLEHGNILELLVEAQELLVVLEGGDHVALLGDREHLLDLVVVLLVGLAQPRPLQEQLLVHLPEAGRHHHIQRRLDDLVVVVAEYALKVATHALDDGLVLAVVDVDAADVLLEDHLGHEEAAGLGGLVDVLALQRKQFLFVDRLAEFLDELGLELLIAHVKGVADEDELPYLLDLEVLGDALPVVVDLVDQHEVWPQHSHHGTQVDGVILQVLPELQVARQDFLNLLLDFVELVLGNYEVLQVQVAIVELLVEFAVLLHHDPPQSS